MSVNHSPAAQAAGLRRLRRITSSGRFIPEIDGLRFIAIATVVLYHLRGYLLVKAAPFAGDPTRGLVARVFEHGNHGVELFFVISGFILALPFAGHQINGAKPVSLKAYYLRRVTRLEPPYIISTLLIFGLLVAVLHSSATALAPHLAATLLYVHNIVYNGESTINAVAWSLEVEIQFYLLVPLLARLYRIRSVTKRRSLILGIIGGTLLVQTVVIPHDSFRYSQSIVGYLQYFLCGFLLADFYLVEWRSRPAASSAWDVASLIGWPLLPILWTSDVLTHWVFPGVALGLYCAAFRGRWSRRFFSVPFITAIGGMCYTTYLLHYQIISLVGRHTIGWRATDWFDGEFMWQVLLIGPAILVACGGFFMLVERPCMRPDWPRRLIAWGRGRASLVSAPTGSEPG